MSPQDKVVVVIPCLNEAKEIFSLVTAVRKFLPNVIVFDDGSTDDTAALAAKAGAEVLRNKTSLGKGRALNAGFKYARERGFPFALAMDGDGQHAPYDIPKFLAAMERAPLVIGNRMENCAQMPWLRSFVNRWMSRQLSRVAGKELPDTQCGFRLIQLEAWSRLDLRTSHFEIESELLLGFAAAGHAIEFVPIEVIYKNEQSKIHPVRDTIRWFRWRKISGCNSAYRIYLARGKHHARAKIIPDLRIENSRAVRQLAPVIHAKAALDRKQTIVAKMFWKISGMQNEPDDSVKKRVALHVAQENDLPGNPPRFAKVLGNFFVACEVMRHLIGNDDVETLVFKRKRERGTSDRFSVPTKL